MRTLCKHKLEARVKIRKHCAFVLGHNKFTGFEEAVAYVVLYLLQIYDDYLIKVCLHLYCPLTRLL